MTRLIQLPSLIDRGEPHSQAEPSLPHWKGLILGGSTSSSRQSGALLSLLPLRNVLNQLFVVGLRQIRIPSS